MRPTLSIGGLKRQAVFAQLFPALSPDFVLGTLRIIGGRVGTRKFNGIDAIEVANLVALRLEPDVLYAGDLPGHGAQAGQSLVFVVLGRSVLPFVHDQMNDGLGLPKAVLRRHTAGITGSGSHAGEK